jgi:hypothetical protein
VKTEDLFNLEAIGISEDRDLLSIMSSLDKLLVNIALGVDNLTGINTHFTTYVENIKALIYDVEHDKQKNLSELGLDSKVQDFIKFKLALETYYININTMMDYLTSAISVVNQCVELKE